MGDNDIDISYPISIIHIDIHIDISLMFRSPISISHTDIGSYPVNLHFSAFGVDACWYKCITRHPMTWRA